MTQLMKNWIAASVVALAAAYSGLSATKATADDGRLTVVPAVQVTTGDQTTTNVQPVNWRRGGGYRGFHGARFGYGGGFYGRRFGYGGGFYGPRFAYGRPGMYGPGFYGRPYYAVRPVYGGYGGYGGYYGNPYYRPNMYAYPAYGYGYGPYAGGGFY